MIINYPGNKKALSKKIIEYIPSNISTYIEPFSGSFFVYFNLPYNKVLNTKIVYNDLNYDLVKIFEYIKSNGIYKILNLNIDEYSYNQILIKKKRTSLEYLLLLLCSDSIINFKYKNSNYLEWLKMNIHNYYHYIESIDHFENHTYIDSILKYDSLNSFFYLDPPYVNKEYFYGIENMNHGLLSDTLKNIKGRFILSYSYFDGLFELYDGFDIINIHNGHQKEFIIKNF